MLKIIMIDSLTSRVRAIYAELRRETDSEPQVTYPQLVAIAEKEVVRSCINCSSHGFNLCPIHPLRTYKHLDPNDCPDWRAKDASKRY